jgi:hypothetical protein
MKKFEIEVSEENEGTANPYWIIIDPNEEEEEDLNCFEDGEDYKTKKGGINNIAFMVTGLFFSREEAENYIKNKSYNYSRNAKVYCYSAVYDCQYSRKMRDANQRLVSIPRFCGNPEIMGDLG